MPEVDQDWLLEVKRSDSGFLRKVGIAPCLVEDPFLMPLPLLLPEEPAIPRLTAKDKNWVQACGVAWEPEPGFQLPMDFCGHP
jgi:hypothetical protein